MLHHPTSAPESPASAHHPTSAPESPASVHHPTSAPESPASPPALAQPRRRLAFFLHEPLGARRSSTLRAGLIADGTTRGGPNGLAQGARRVVECAERCAERGDVELLGVFILSPKNVLRRKKPFFAALHAEMLRLLEGVASGRVLSGVRVEVHGRLDRLRRKGGPAARLGAVLELLVETTRMLAEPKLRLVFGVDYGEDAPIALGLDLLVRTGMEAPSVLRLSGLRVRPDTVCVPSVKLWRDFSPDDLEEALATVPRTPRVDLAPGFAIPFVEGLLDELSRARLDDSVQITVPVAASREEVAGLLERAARTPPLRSGAVALTAAVGATRSPRRLGPGSAWVRVRLVSSGRGNLAPPGAPVAWIAPGQSSSVFHLLERSAGDANVHGCEPTPAGVVDGLRRALCFHREHPQLHGAPRPALERAGEEEGRSEGLLRHVAARASVPAEAIAAELAAGEAPETGLLGQVFAAKCMLETRGSGLMSGEVDWTRQALGYALTAFVIGVPPPSASEPDWEPRSRALAQVMLALASSDEEISDRLFEGEARGAQRARISRSVDYLLEGLEGGSPPSAAPDVPGARVLESIARVWDGFFGGAALRGDRALVSGTRRAAAALYRANLDELSAGDGLFAALWQSPSVRAAEALEERCARLAPGPVAARVRELVREVLADPRRAPEEVGRELGLLDRLVRVAPSIGAGCALLAMAATEPAEAVPAGAAEVMLSAAPLIDCYFRLANDLAFTDVTRGDRDRKPTTFTCLVPPGLRGKEREHACVKALQTCRTTAAWLRAEIRRALEVLSGVWPRAARWWRRGVLFGQRVYEGGHYERLTWEAAAAIVAEVTSLDAAPSRKGETVFRSSHFPSRLWHSSGMSSEAL